MQEMRADAKISAVSAVSASIAAGSSSNGDGHSDSRAKREVDEAMRYRLVIEPGSANGTFVYKTLDRLTGEVVRQLPREEVMRLRDDAGYNAGRVVDTRA